MTVFDRHYSDARRKVRRSYSWTSDDSGKPVPKSAKRWEVRFTDTAGRQRYERFEDRTSAHARSDELVEQFRSGSYIEHERARVTVQTVAETYMRTLTAKSASTRSSYGAIVDVFCREFGDRELGSLVVSDVNGWIADLLGEGKSTVSLRKYVAVVRLMLDVAVEDRLMRSNPARAAKVPKTDRSSAPTESADRDDYLTPHDLDVLLPYIADEHTRRLLRFQSLTGLRIGELCELRRKDLVEVDLGSVKRWKLVVRRSAVETKGGLVIGLTKSGRERSVPLDEDAEVSMREALSGLESRLPKVKKATKGRSRTAADVREINEMLASMLGEELLFPTARGSQHRGSNVNRALASACVAAGVAKVTTHDMRHAWASNAIAVGTDPVRVAKLLGHVDSTLVHKVYGHAGGDDELFAAVDRIGQANLLSAQSKHT